MIISHLGVGIQEVAVMCLVNYKLGLMTCNTLYDWVSDVSGEPQLTLLQVTPYTIGCQMCLVNNIAGADGI